MRNKFLCKKSENKKKKKSSMGAIFLIGLLVSAMAPIRAYATGVDSVTQPLNNLKTLVVTIIGVIGVIILAKNVMEFAQGYQQQDSSSMNSGLKGIVAGLLMASISAVLTFLGIS